jgi:hypothetical protein
MPDPITSDNFSELWEQNSLYGHPDDEPLSRSDDIKSGALRDNRLLRLRFYPEAWSTLLERLLKFAGACLVFAVVTCLFSIISYWERHENRPPIVRDWYLATLPFCVGCSAAAAHLLRRHLRSLDRIERSFVGRIIAAIVHLRGISTSAERILRIAFFVAFLALCAKIYFQQPIFEWMDCVARRQGACGLPPPSTPSAAPAEPEYWVVFLYSLWNAAWYGVFLMLVLSASYQYAQLKRIGFWMNRVLDQNIETSDANISVTKPKGYKLSVVHLSDLHITADASTKRVEVRAKEKLRRNLPRSQYGGNTNLTELLKRHGDNLRSCDVVLATGDMTDSGARAEWKCLKGMLGEALWKGDKLVLVPGNHDLNFVRSSRMFGVSESSAYLARAARLVRTLSVLDDVQGDRARLLYRGELCTFREYLRKEWKVINRFFCSPDDDGAEAVHKLWQEAFPMVVDLKNARGERTVCFVFDSIQRASYWATNAFGWIESGAIDRARILRLQYYSSVPRIYALHHHVKLHDEQLKLRDVQPLGMVLANAREIVDFLQEDQHAVVFHGHKHIGREFKLGDRIAVLSAASSTLGDESKQKASKDGEVAGARALCDPGFTVYYLNGRQQADHVLEVVGKQRFDLREEAIGAPSVANEEGLDQPSLSDTVAAE